MVDLLTTKTAKEAAETATSAACTTGTDPNSQRHVERCIAESRIGGIAQIDLAGSGAPRRGLALGWYLKHRSRYPIAAIALRNESMMSSRGGVASGPCGFKGPVDVSNVLFRLTTPRIRVHDVHCALTDGVVGPPKHPQACIRLADTIASRSRYRATLVAIWQPSPGPGTPQTPRSYPRPTARKKRAADFE